MKPRFDGKGTAFANAHRELPPYCGMFDLDGGKATMSVDATLRKQDSGYFEYRYDWNTCEYTYPALFEVKYKMSDAVKRMMLEHKGGTALSAEINIAKKIGARFFLVVETEGKPPFHLYEWIYDIQKWKYWNTYDKNTIKDKWKEIGLIK